MRKYYLSLVLLALLGSGCTKSKSPVGNNAVNEINAKNHDSQEVVITGMKKFSDKEFGFAFYYPESLSLNQVQIRKDSYPGGTVIKSLQLGDVDGPVLTLVDSVQSSITDQPNVHAGPISQTKYFYDKNTEKWMVAYPEDVNQGSAFATTTADVSIKTIGDLPMLKTGIRFDGSIIPLSTTRFIVISDGGTGTAPAIAKTIHMVNTTIDKAVLKDAVMKVKEVYRK